MDRGFDVMQFIYRASAMAYCMVMAPDFPVSDKPEDMSGAATSRANRVIMSPSTLRTLLTHEQGRYHVHYDPKTGEAELEGVKVILDVNAPFGHFATGYVTPYHKP